MTDIPLANRQLISIMVCYRSNFVQSLLAFRYVLWFTHGTGEPCDEQCPACNGSSLYTDSYGNNCCGRGSRDQTELTPTGQGIKFILPPLQQSRTAGDNFYDLYRQAGALSVKNYRILQHTYRLITVGDTGTKANHETYAGQQRPPAATKSPTWESDRAPHSATLHAGYAGYRPPPTLAIAALLA